MLEPRCFGAYEGNIIKTVYEVDSESQPLKMNVLNVVLKAGCATEFPWARCPLPFKTLPEQPKQLNLRGKAVGYRVLSLIANVLPIRVLECVELEKGVTGNNFVWNTSTR